MGLPLRCIMPIVVGNMVILNAVLIIGLILRPIQIIVMTYLAYIQWKELRIVTPYQTVKKLLFSLFVINTAVYLFSLFIDLVGLFGWFRSLDTFFLVTYLAVNVTSATLVTALLLIVYKLRIKDPR